MNEDSNFGNIPSHDHSFSDSHDYLSRAQYAVESGDRILGIHLYLAAFEQSILENIVPSEESVNGMRAAWDLAVDARQHSLAEYIFEKLKPFVSAEELSRKADQLQDVALDRLEEFGFSREAIEDMAEMINDDLFNLPPDLLYRYEDDNVPSPFSFLDLSSKSDSASNENDAASIAEASDRAEEVKAEPIEPEQKEANPTAEADEEPLELPAFPLPNLKGAKIAHIDLSGKKKKKKKAPEVHFDYSTIHGFSRAIEEMKRLGVGRMRDPQFKEFVKMLNFRHGVSRMPQLGTLVFSGATSWWQQWGSLAFLLFACAWTRTYKASQCFASWLHLMRSPIRLRSIVSASKVLRRSSWKILTCGICLGWISGRAIFPISFRCSFRVVHARRWRSSSKRSRTLK